MIEMSICLKETHTTYILTQKRNRIYECELYEDEIDSGLTTPMTEDEAAFNEYLRNN